MIKSFHETLPKFPDGRIDYSNSDTAPVVSIFVKYNDEILLLKRSDKVSSYKEKWNNIGGYIDEVKSIKEKALEELKEETGIDKKMIASIKMEEPSAFVDEEINKTWLLHPFIIELKEKPIVKLDWEHVEYKWVKLEEIENFDTVPNLSENIKKFFH